MKRMLALVVCLLLAAGLTACSGTPVSPASGSRVPTQTGNNGSVSPSENGQGTEKVTGKTIVIYFSRTNNTEKIANDIVAITGADKYEIEAKIPYTDADVNYNDPDSRTSKEQNDPTARPEIGSAEFDLSEYDVVYLGYPIWWGQAPKILYTFVESHDWNGKTVIPFCTSASSGVGSSATNLSKSAPGALWKEGKRFSGSAGKNEVETWIKSINP